MESSLFFFPLTLLLLSNIIIKPISPTTLQNLNTDQNALLQFKNTITSDNPHEDDVLAKNWSAKTSVCDWIGVSCGIKHQRVIGLNISDFGLGGTLTPYLGNLTFLRYLDISHNNFTGIIPPELSRLYRLRLINMGVNSFTGQIPSWLGALPQLEKLGLYNNSFSGTIPPALFKNCKLRNISMHFNFLNGSIPGEIGNCFSLQVVKLDYNQLTGSIPYGIFNLSSISEIRITNNGLSGRLPSDVCNNLPKLTALSLWGNQIEGQIPSNIWKCGELEVLDLSFNHFNGTIPGEIGSLRKLTKLFLEVNDFQGGVPPELGNLSRLEILNLQSVSLTGPIPKEIGNCTSLKEVGLGGNSLTGELPEELSNLPFLESFIAFNNSLLGSIPSSIFNISTLSNLDLAFNQFSGNLHMPSEFSLYSLEVLQLHQNELSGEIPSSITNFSKLTHLELSNNSFSGSVPNFGKLGLLRILKILGNNLNGAESPSQELGFLSSLANCQYLEILGISGNPLNGILPASVGNLSTSLRYFYAYDCNITGVIPNTIGNLSSLIVLALHENQLTGLIPQTVGKLNKLQGLSLQGNRLHGYIPPDLCRLSNMFVLALGDNILTGPIPDCLGDVQSLRNIYLQSNKLSSVIPSNFWNLKDLLILDLSSNYLTGQLSSLITSLKVITKLNMSNNQFSGDIPNSIDGCQSLQYLSFSNNNLEGSIPPSLGNIKGLITLDCSNNSLSGSIPESLEGLMFLQHLNVSCNKLEGEIPSRGPFIQFSAQSFLNNSALCGEHRFQVHPCTRKDMTKSIKNKVVHLMKYILPPFILVITLATIIVILLVRRRKLKRVQAPTDIALGVAWRRISYIELVKGTNAFSEANLLGRGRFASVFKATLSDGFDVAVKVFNLQFERAVRSFDTECEILSNIRHKNLVRIIGCCSNTEFKALILGYMPNGSLEKWLYSDNYCLGLIQRLQIAIDVASALEYLHHGHMFPVVHCDIKPGNVLLDDDMVAHLADFGISKLFTDGENMIQTKTLATIGYAAPEYGSEGKVSPSGDVYSYAILLLEIFTMKKPTDDMFSEKMSLKNWVQKALQDNTVSEVSAPTLLTRDDQHFCAKEECVSSIFRMAMKCLAISPDERINMIEIVAALQRIKTKVVAGTREHQQYVVLPITVGQ